MKASRFLIVLTIVSLVVSFFYFDISDYLQLEYLKNQRDEFSNFYETNPLATVTAYMLLYILTTACLPGATILTLAGGAIFGLKLVHLSYHLSTIGS